MAEVDLHLHTTRSDGRLTPTELVHLAVRKGLRVIAVTDHDTTAGIEEALAAAKAFPQLTIISGTEISTDVAGGEIHILAYFVNKDDPGFQKELARFRAARYERGRKMVDKLAQMGMPLAWERVLEIAGDASVGRPHVARALVEKGYVATTQEAFDKYLGRNCPAYAEREKLTPEQAIALALENGALPVLAHPSYVTGLNECLPGLKRAGLAGMEVYCGGLPPEEVGALLALARLHGLVPCGGSDYHANGHAGEVEPGSVGPPLAVVEQLRALQAQRAGR